MNTEYLLGGALGSAIASTLLMFALAALAIQGQRKAKLGWRQGLMFFGISVALVAALNVALYIAVPSLITSSETTALGLLQSFGFPLLISVLVLLLLWKPKAS